MLVDSHAPASLQMRAAQLSNENPRRPSTPDVAQAARWWPRESSGWPYWLKADERESERAPEAAQGGRENTAGPSATVLMSANSGMKSQPWALAVNEWTACSVGPNLGHTALHSGRRCRPPLSKKPMREILGNSSSG